MECFRLEAKKCPVVMVADVCTNSIVRKISSVPVSIVTHSCCLISIGNCFDVFVNTWVTSLFLGTYGHCVTTPCCGYRKHHYMRFYILSPKKPARFDLLQLDQILNDVQNFSLLECKKSIEFAEKPA